MIRSASLSLSKHPHERQKERKKEKQFREVTRETSVRGREEKPRQTARRQPDRLCKSGEGEASERKDVGWIEKKNP